MTDNDTLLQIKYAVDQLCNISKKLYDIKNGFLDSVTIKTYSPSNGSNPYEVQQFDNTIKDIVINFLLDLRTYYINQLKDMGVNVESFITIKNNN